MNIRKSPHYLLAFTSSLVLFLSPVYADTVDWGMIGGGIFTDDGYSVVVPDSTLARFGTYATGYDFTGKSYATLYDDFDEWASDTSMVDGQFAAFNADTTGPVGTPWYYFIGNSASSFGIFTNAAWTNNGDPFVRPSDLSDPGTYAPGGFGAVDSVNGNVALIPEPTAFALIAIGSTAFLLLRRPRRS